MIKRRTLWFYVLAKIMKKVQRITSFVGLLIIINYLTIVITPFGHSFAQIPHPTQRL